MKTVIIDYNAGNVRSVLFALKRLQIDAVLTADPEQIRTADKVIFPGVGEAATTMAYLKSRQLDRLIKDLKQPVLGICLGMQLLCEYSEEGNTDCIGVIPQKVKKFIPNHQQQKVPHVGWNSLDKIHQGFVSTQLEKKFVYFVHSYFVEEGPYTIGTTNYIQPFSAMLQKDNFYATQFHPEKSGTVGEQILENFLAIP